MPKGTVALMEQRITEIYKLLLLGAGRSDILQHASKKQWDVENRTVDEYISRATSLLKKKSEIDRDYMLNMARERLQMLYMRALSVQDLKTALAVQKEINTLEGLYPVQNKKIEHSGGIQIQWTDPVSKDDDVGIGAGELP